MLGRRFVRVAVGVAAVLSLTLLLGLVPGQPSPWALWGLRPRDVPWPSPFSPKSPKASKDQLSTSGEVGRDLGSKTPQRYAVVIMATNRAYIAGFQVLAYSVSKWVRPNTDLVAMFMEGEELDELARLALERVGFSVRPVKRIKPPRPPMAQFKDQFTKLHLWEMDEYKRVLYMDCDMFTIRDCGEALYDVADSLELATVFDSAWNHFTKKDHRPVFNAGFLSVRPNRTRYTELVSLLQSNRVSYHAVNAEQAWLYALMEKSFLELDPMLNVNTHVYTDHRQEWNGYKDKIKGVHITMRKYYLFSAADFDKKDEPARWLYDLQQEAVFRNGSLWGAVTAGDCHFLNSASHVQKRFPNSSTCGKAPKDLLSPEGARYVSNFCSPELLGRVGQLNPLLLGWSFWLDAAALAKDAEPIARLLHKDLPSDTLPLDKFRTVGLGKGLCPVGFGGVRFAAEAWGLDVVRGPSKSWGPITSRSGWGHCEHSLSAFAFAAAVVSDIQTTVRGGTLPCPPTLAPNPCL